MVKTILQGGPLQWGQIKGWIEPVSNGVVVVAVSVYLYRVVTFKNNQSTASKQ
jgi:hypothetical protein